MALNTSPLRHDHDIQVFSKEEIGARKDRLTAYMRQAGLDAVLLHSADNVFYLSGVPLLSEWGRPMWYVQKSNGDAAVIGSGIERESMESAHHAETLWYDDSQAVLISALDLAEKFVGGKAPRLAVEAGLLLESVRTQLEARLKVEELIDVSPQIEEMRLIKSVEEFDLLRIGGQVAKIGADAFLDALRPGVTELQVSSAAVYAMNVATAALIPSGLSSTYAYCQTGMHTMTPHLHASGRRIKQGDLIGLNVFPTISGYCVELERTLVLGEATAEQDRALQITHKAFAAGKAAVENGAVMSSINKAALGPMIEAGYGDSIRCGSGHAHGIMIGSAGREEQGELRDYNDRVIVPGIACSVEPGIFVADLGCFRHSDVLLVHQDGSVECVTEYDVEF